MSSYCKRLAKHERTRFENLSNRKYVKESPKYFTSFNIFTSDGQNLTVESEKPMTLYEAQYHYKALSISGNE